MGLKTKWGGFMYGRFTKIIVAFTSLVLMSTGAFGRGLAKEAKVHFGSIAVKKLIVMPSAQGHSDWVDAINGAKSKVHMTMFHLTDKAVITALVAKAHDSAVDVRVIVDGKSIRGGYARAVQQLKRGGVSVIGSSREFSLTHSKDMVIDDKVAFIGAIDMTNTAGRMRDFAIETTDADIISDVEQVFEADWQNAHKKTAITPDVSDTNLVLSPTNSDSQIVDLIDSATTTLVAESEFLDNDDVISAFNRAAQRGVAVRIVLPECSLGHAGINYKGISQLSGVEVHMEHNGNSIEQPYMHSKMMVVDGQTVYVGSINFSFNSINNDRELGVIFTDPTTASQLSTEFEKDWNRSQTPSPKPACASFAADFSLMGRSAFFQ